MSASKDCSTVTGMKSLIGKRFSHHVIGLLNSTFPHADYIAEGVGRGERVAVERHMGVLYFQTVSKLDRPFSLTVKMRILSCWFANRSLHLPVTWVSGRTNMIDNRARMCVSDANHLALNICELVKLIEFIACGEQWLCWNIFLSFFLSNIIALETSFKNTKTFKVPIVCFFEYYLS